MDLSYKRGGENPDLNKLSKPMLLCFQHARDQQVPDYNHIFAWLWQNYDCKQVFDGLLHAVEMTEVALLKVFRIGFQASQHPSLKPCFKQVQLSNLGTSWGKKSDLKKVVMQTYV